MKEKDYQRFLKSFKQLFYADYQRLPNKKELRFVKIELKVNNLLCYSAK